LITAAIPTWLTEGTYLMTNHKLLAGVATFAMFVSGAAMASETTDYRLGSDISIEQAASMLHYSGGNDRFRVELAPNYSEELGFSMKGAAGGYLTDAIALGLIVEYGENKREYLANAGIQFNDALSFVGTVGLLEEHNEYVDGEGREKVQQMEYGASLKGAYEIGFLSGFELNGYLVDADEDTDRVESGKLYGFQLLTDLDLTDTTHVKIGGGYEWLEWDAIYEDDNRWTFSAEAVQQLGDVVSLTGIAKLGASEFVYGGGVAFDLSDGGMNTNMLGVNASYIDGRNGIEDDQRIELSWTFGFGAGPTTSVAAADLTDKSGTIRAAADVSTVTPANNLLSDVMKRPTFLPERVLARSNVIVSQIWSRAVEAGDTNGTIDDPRGDTIEVKLLESIRALGVGLDDIDWTLYVLTDGTTFKSTTIFDDGGSNTNVYFTGIAFGYGSIGGCNREDMKLVGTVKVDGKIYVQQQLLTYRSFC
jgi:hypothetical protein